MANRNIAVRDLNPGCIGLSYISFMTETDFIFLGKKNLERLKQYWRSEERDLLNRVKEAQADVDILAGKTPEDIKAMAAEYESPDFPDIVMIHDDKHFMTYPEPSDAASAERKAGATTFNFCGWCKHNGANFGYRWHNCDTATYCPLIPRELGNGYNYSSEPSFRFNTPCAIVEKGTQEILDACVEHLEDRKARLVVEKRHHSHCVRYLGRLIGRAEEKPPFAEFRPRGWFNRDDRIVVISYCYDKALSRTTYAFIQSRVTDVGLSRNREEFVDGGDRVLISRDEPLRYDLNDADSFEREGLESRNPRILHDWEFEYLKAHPDYLKIWVCHPEDPLYKFIGKAFADYLPEA